MLAIDPASDAMPQRSRVSPVTTVFVAERPALLRSVVFLSGIQIADAATTPETAEWASAT